MSTDPQPLLGPTVQISRSHNLSFWGGHSSPLLFPRRHLPCCRPKSGEQQKGWGKQVETAGMSESQ